MHNAPANWPSVGQDLHMETRALINGQWRSASDGKTFAKHSPIDGSLLTHVTACSPSDVDDAVQAARSAFERGAWSGLSPSERKATLKRLAELVRVNVNELALLDTLDMGKPLTESIEDAQDSAACIDWYAEAIDKRNDEVLPLAPHLLGLATREPVGVVAAVVPWNYPLQMAVWKVAPALATGNSVLLKPSSKSPLSALKLGQLCRAAGVPDGVFQVLPGPAAIGEQLGRHMDVDCIVFTGSTKVGKAIQRYSAESNLKRTWLELGGKSPLIIFADCPDLDAAAENAAGSIFGNQGEVCSAASRLFVHASIADAFIPKLVDAAQDHVPGNPLDPSTTMGALVDEPHLETVHRHVERGLRDGAMLLCGGRRARVGRGGSYYEPTILLCPHGDMAVVREEIFGPVLTVQTFIDTDEVIRQANDSPYGLAAGLWTSSLGTAHAVARRLRAGTVFVNGWDEGGDDYCVPFGGYKQSGNGRDKSLHALDKYTEIKATVFRHTLAS
ncbi:aldehyde dehydrogenase family protein [Ideonella sp.]|uniref:aldehyde dehydrogenase family protein n=1 Tax=Ideonella sp. TaxID=1929293 RepID=UPI0035B12E05